MADQRLRINNFQGGISDDEKFGQPYSFSEGQSIDFRQSPGLLTTTQKTTKESGSTITTEVCDMVRVDQNSGDVYMAGKTKIYKRAAGTNGAAGTYSTDSSDSNLKNVQDLDYRPDIDALWLIDKTVIHEKSPLSGGGSYTYNKYKQYVQTSQTASGGAYTLPAALTEADKYSFSSEVDNLYSIKLRVANKGAGNWTLTLHDGNNNSLGSVVVLAASVPAAGNDIEFVFSAPIRLKLNNTYHIHAQSSDGAGTVLSTSANTLPLAQVSLLITRLIDTGAYGHATIQVAAKSYICNERYLAEWEPLDTTTDGTSGYNPFKLVFPAECIAISTAMYNEYVAVGAALKRGTDTADQTPTEGIIFFWDGVSVFYSFSLPVPQGAPNSLFCQDNTLYFEAKGRWYKWAGGDIEAIYEFPGVDSFTATAGAPAVDFYLRAARKAVTSRGSTVLMGFPYASANSAVSVGVFGYGRNKIAANGSQKTISYDHILSTGNVTPQFDTSTSPDTPVTGITCLKNFGGNLLIAWKDVASNVTSYGVDLVNDASAGAASGGWASLWFDNGDADKEKSAKSVKVTFRALPADCTITPKYRFDRASSWVTDASGVASAGATEARLTVPSEASRFKEAMFGFDFTSSSGNKPQIISVNFKYDDLEEEEHDT